eukprot:CAMPEP_0178892886 /NCGR_PEP_ID=MMETSP0747-20121128/19730_1 /TAXON_ID=913974 /ORGANISM="Nitzschia punctata, Strain CCMP561" /LENGTH=83 /DNA_ID=CAMNT_0020562865 /DNA_START=160 /DNA_END=411 /DNA_ORIENTATION=+
MEFPPKPSVRQPMCAAVAKNMSRTRKVMPIDMPISEERSRLEVAYPKAKARRIVREMLCMPLRWSSLGGSEKWNTAVSHWGGQ